MAWIERAQKKTCEVYRVRWREESRTIRSRIFRDQAQAEEFRAEMDRQWPDRRPARRERQFIPLDVRIKKFVAVSESGCWEWTGRRTNQGYGCIGVYVDGKQKFKLAHRVSYETFRGPIPDGLQLDHLCRVRYCVNPDHLEPVTGSENVQRSPLTLAHINAKKTHCVNGHEYTPENTGRDAKGYRYCRACIAAAARRYQARKKAAR